MASLKNILPDKRRTTVLLSLIFLLALFLVPYFFVFIPANADSLKRQAFLKLDRAVKNLISKSNDTRNYYLTLDSGMIWLDSNLINGAECSSNGKDRLSQQDGVYFMQYGAGGWKILFIANPDSTIRVGFMPAYELALDSFTDACLASAKEIFSSFLMIHYCQKVGVDSGSKIIYQSFSQGMEQNINLDSLVPRHEGLRSPDISDITMEGTDYKLFSYPFQLGHHRLILCGLMKTDSYNAKLHVIPLPIVYSLVICLVLFLLSLPFLKIFMMNERDRIFGFNLIIGIVFLFAMASLITIICTQLIMLKQGKIQVNENLKALSAKLDNSLSGELAIAQDELIYFDKRLLNYMDTSKTDTSSIAGTPNFLITTIPSSEDMAFQKQSRILSGHWPRYHNTDHYSWISGEGQEIVRIKYIPDDLAKVLANNDNPDTIRFVDVRKRPYFQEMAKRFRYHKANDSMLMIAPVQSWASGEFRVNLIRYSDINGLMLELMETRLYSLVNTVLPGGYGFCLFDDQGNVLIHSDSLKSLRENFLDETGRLPWILGAVRARQPMSSGSVAFYGSDYMLHIQPLKQHPLFLAVFYNNDYLEPSNLRVLTFSIFFCLLTYGLLFLIFPVLNPRDPKTCLYSPVDYFRYLIPRKEKLRFYFKGSFLLVFYMLCFSLVSIVSPAIGYDVDYTVMVFGILTPFNILYALWLLQNTGDKFKGAKTLRLVWPAIFTGVLIFVLSLITNWKLEFFSFLIMEILLCCGFAEIVRLKGKKWRAFIGGIGQFVKVISGWENKNIEERKLFSYSWFITFFIFAVSVLPPLEYSWFAYNHELRQSIKKEQLELADGLQKREYNIRAFMRANQPDFSGNDSNFNFLQYYQGIYSNFPGRIVPLKDNPDTSRLEGGHDRHSESFYLSMANAINLFYKDPSGLPPLNDSSVADNLWHWDVNQDSCEFDYSRYKWKVPPLLSDSKPPGISFKIITAIPGGLQIGIRLQFLFSGMLLVLLFAIYWLTRSITRQVYQTKIIGNAGTGLDQQYGRVDSGPWEKAMFENNAGFSVSGLLNDLKGEYTEFADANIPLAYREFAIIKKSREMKPLFESVWKTLDDQEKYLLICLANDGLLNHKNEPVIYELLDKNLLIVYDERIRLVSYSFRNFIISRNNSPEDRMLLAAMQSGASWSFMRTIVLVVVMSVFIFLFLTQQEVSAKIIALVTSLSALLPLILKFSSSSVSGNK